MSSKIYNIELDGKLIGTTRLEKADASMGVAFGQISFIDKFDQYQTLKNIFTSKGIQLTDEPEFELFMTHGPIDGIKITNDSCVEIKGIGIQISGSNQDGFEVSVEGIPYPFYEEEFPHHVKRYNNMFENE